MGDWTCLRAEPRDGETFQELCRRLKVVQEMGGTFYQLIRTEKISAAKELAMLRGGKWTVGGNEVRAALGLGRGAISVRPGDIPADVELFVQSVSYNRKLSSRGAALIRCVSTTQ